VLRLGSGFVSGSSVEGGVSSSIEGNSNWVGVVRGMKGSFSSKFRVFFGYRPLGMVLIPPADTGTNLPFLSFLLSEFKLSSFPSR